MLQYILKYGHILYSSLAIDCSVFIASKLVNIPFSSLIFDHMSLFFTEFILVMNYLLAQLIFRGPFFFFLCLVSQKHMSCYLNVELSCACVSDKQLAMLTWLHVIKMHLNDLGVFAENVGVHCKMANQACI